MEGDDKVTTATGGRPDQRRFKEGFLIERGLEPVDLPEVRGTGGAGLHPSRHWARQVLHQFTSPHQDTPTALTRAHVHFHRPETGEHPDRKWEKAQAAPLPTAALLMFPLCLHVP